ncbi:MAG: hypothetical protein D6719_02100 [Candidatus Dadabacteria bacterium]|nr:MAG: hypothetical protein D6719_02100 [Candidatus Dadabacteria bacterium]
MKGSKSGGLKNYCSSCAVNRFLNGLLLITAFLLIMKAGCSSAQEQQELKSAKQQVLKQISTTLAIPESSRFYKEIESQFSYSTSNTNGTFQLKLKRGKSGIYAHYRGNHGIKFPAEDELEGEIPFTRDDARKIAQKYNEYFKAAAANIQKVAVLPACKSSHTEKTKRFNATESKTANVLIDMLFVSIDKQKELPFIPDKNLALKYYGRSGPDSVLAKTLKIPCLPYRIRVTEKYVYRLSGRAAFKSYDIQNSTDKKELTLATGNENKN